MELSQTALAMLLLGGFPFGLALNLVYALTDFGALPESIVKKLLCNAKDFVFALMAGLLAIMLVYYVNDGEFRYLIVIGLIAGFVISQLILGKPVVHIRNALIRILSTPLIFIWRMTFGKILEKARKSSQRKQTQERINEMMQLASNGFEN